MAASATTLSVKLLIDRKAQRVLFAEAGKDVVDFLFSLLALPVATAVKLVGEGSVAGSVGNLYASVDRLDSTYVQPGAAKDSLLRPAVLSAAAAGSSLLCLPAPPSGQPKSFYRCSYLQTSTCYHYVTDASGTSCPQCGKKMTAVVQYVPPAQKQEQDVYTGATKGFVQGIVTYTVLDNLTVTPMSTISGITLLNTFTVRDLADLQERTAQLGYNEGLAILKASLQSNTVLTDVFLGNKKARRGRA
ncbi:hypothetical protein PAHAL_5G477100 [Panicum hallii]|uniref:DUF674 domain-containing protein n=1 Tax=Panicum hallii TaxID=206008 RepID=A0A2S3HXV4_9POAL|nr:hypothetical protein PAHAL_5G477100 [Panicum hallii]